jgi:hypothetical protein
MHPDVHRYLDGELPRDALSPAAAAELQAWEQLDTTLAERRADAAPPWLADAVMRALPPTPAAVERSRRPSLQRGWQRVWQWLVTPRPLAVRPLAPLAGAAALLLVVLMQPVTRSAPGTVPAEAADAPMIYVQFALDAAGARSVVVAGDFNDWSLETGTLRDVHGDGVFRGLVPVRPGVHKYMFVIDGDQWVTDPAAERHVDDGFGMRNALLAVLHPDEVL